MSLSLAMPTKQQLQQLLLQQNLGDGSARSPALSFPLATSQHKCPKHNNRSMFHDIHVYIHLCPVIGCHCLRMHALVCT